MSDMPAAADETKPADTPSTTPDEPGSTDTDTDTDRAVPEPEPEPVPEAEPEPEPEPEPAGTPLPAEASVPGDTPSPTEAAAGQAPAGGEAPPPPGDAPDPVPGETDAPAPATLSPTPTEDAAGQAPAGAETPPPVVRMGVYGPLPHLPPPSDRRRRRLSTIGGFLAIAALLFGLARGGVFDWPEDDATLPIAQSQTDAAPAPTPTPPPVTTITAFDVLDITNARTKALKSGNVTAFLTGVDPKATRLVADQRRLFTNLRLFPFFVAEYRAPGGAIDAGDDAGPLTREVTVVFSHQLTGVDSAPVAERYRWTLTRASVDAPVLITAITGASTRGGGNAYPAPWDEGPLVLVERPHVLLAVPVKSKAKAKAWADRAEAALKRNLAVWKGPALAPERYVIYVTPDHATFVRALSGNDLPNVTGVCRTLPPSSPSGPDVTMAGSRITLDGSDDVFTDNDTEQQTHLMRHELGHAMVAQFEHGDGPPLWVSEGFAEYLAWTDFSLAEWYQPDARAQVDAGRFDGKLPTDAEVNSADAETAGIHYHYSMLTIRYIAEKYGTAKADTFVVEVYKDESRLDVALKAATGQDRATFERNWARYVKTKVGG